MYIESLFNLPVAGVFFFLVVCEKYRHEGLFLSQSIRFQNSTGGAGCPVYVKVFELKI